MNELIHDDMPYDPMQGQGHGGLKCTEIHVGTLG